jgi:hypothetical protein
MQERMTTSEYRKLAQKGGKVKTEKPKDLRDWNKRYRSKAEEAFARRGWLEFETWINSVMSHGRLHELVYEPISLNIPGGRYTPDFMALFGLERWRAMVEVKATKYQPSYRDSRSKIRAAARVHRWDRFFVAWYKNGAWTFEEIR